MHLLPATILLLAPIHACVIYQAISPFSDIAPFQATLTDNGLTTCWLSLSYAAHSSLQAQYSLSLARSRSLKSATQKASFEPPSSQNPQRQNQRSKRFIHLSTKQSLKANSHDPEALGANKMPAQPWEELDEWIPWTFECLEGYKAHANVGLRTVVYEVREKEYFLVPEMQVRCPTPLPVVGQQLKIGENQTPSKRET